MLSNVLTLVLGNGFLLFFLGNSNDKNTNNVYHAETQRIDYYKVISFVWTSMNCISGLLTYAVNCRCVEFELNLIRIV